jgi:hypothetical protein
VNLVHLAEMDAGIHVAKTHAGPVVADEGQAHRCHEVAHIDRTMNILPLNVMMAVVRLPTLWSAFAGKAAPSG